MTWTLTSLMIQIVAGLAGGHVAAAAAHEHAFGAIGHTDVAISSPWHIITTGRVSMFAGRTVQRLPPVKL
jgi:hypothetical protein